MPSVLRPSSCLFNLDLHWMPPIAGSWAPSSTVSAPRWRSRPCSSASCTLLRMRWTRRTRRTQRQMLLQMLRPAHARWAGYMRVVCCCGMALLAFICQACGSVDPICPSNFLCYHSLAGPAPAAAQPPVLLARLHGAAAGAATRPRTCAALLPLWGRQAGSVPACQPTGCSLRRHWSRLLFITRPSNVLDCRLTGPL